MHARDKLRWILPIAVGAFLVAVGTQDGSEAYAYAGAAVIFLAVLGAWWHFESLHRTREAEQGAAAPDAGESEDAAPTTERGA